MSTVYRSNILKADTRYVELFFGSKRYQSANNDNIAVKDVFLAAGSRLTLDLSKDDLHIIFPIVGTVSIISEHMHLCPEELYCYCDKDAKELVLENSFPDETINFLHIVIDKSAHGVERNGVSVSTLNINSKNQLVQGNGSASCIKVGVYDSRVKDKTSLSPDCSALFTYVINGSFDFEERLIEYRDSLYQWDVHEVDFEALSDVAIILMIECSLLK